MFVDLLATLSQPFAPDWAAARRRHWQFGNQARALRRLCEEQSTLPGAIDAVLGVDWTASQIPRDQLLALLSRVREARPSTVVVLGPINHGQACLLGHAAPRQARLLFVDPGISTLDQTAGAGLAPPGQEMTFLAADPGLRATFVAVRRWLEGDDLDVLCIDGARPLAEQIDWLDWYTGSMGASGLAALTHETLALMTGLELEDRVRLCRQARALRDKCAALAVDESLYEEVVESRWFPAQQKRGEIVPLLQRVEALEPHLLCEIGAYKGGNLCLFARAAAPDARLLSIDVGYTDTQRAVYPFLARPGQELVCLRADSASPAALDFLRDWLGGQLLDFLFIDGDHWLPGVANDFRLYSPFVRPGGIIAFHDVVPDYLTRHGVDTRFRVGDVPRFWAELKPQLPRVEELIEHPQQDGFGIGVIHWMGAVAVEPPVA